MIEGVYDKQNRVVEKYLESQDAKSCAAGIQSPIENVLIYKATEHTKDYPYSIIRD